nr:unnamed protein product [Digitaria exilis]
MQLRGTAEKSSARKSSRVAGDRRPPSPPARSAWQEAPRRRAGDRDADTAEQKRNGSRTASRVALEARSSHPPSEKKKKKKKKKEGAADRSKEHSPSASMRRGGREIYMLENMLRW